MAINSFHKNRHSYIVWLLGSRNYGAINEIRTDNGHPYDFQSKQG
jgi:hypothetical protein